MKCNARTSDIVGAKQCTREEHTKGGHETKLESGTTYVWWDEPDTTPHTPAPDASVAPLSSGESG